MAQTNENVYIVRGELCDLHRVSKPTDTDLACYNSEVRQPNWTVFGRYIAERVSYHVVTYFSASADWCLCTT